MPSVDPPALRGAARAPRCCENTASCKMLSMENWRDTRHNRWASAVPELCRYPWPLLRITARDARNVTRTCHVTAFDLCAVKQMRQAPSGMNDRINGHRKDRSRRHAPRSADWSTDGRYFSSAYARRLMLASATGSTQQDGTDRSDCGNYGPVRSMPGVPAGKIAPSPIAPSCRYSACASRSAWPLPCQPLGSPSWPSGSCPR